LLELVGVKSVVVAFVGEQLLMRAASEDAAYSNAPKVLAIPA
jgi:hypothetical protein